MKPIAFTAIAALLGACSTTTPTTTAPTVASIGTAKYGIVGGTFGGGGFLIRGYTVTQNGVDHSLPLTASATTRITHNGIHVTNWASGSGAVSGSAGPSSSVHTYAAGLDNGTYFAGISGFPNATIPTTGTASLTGLYAFVVNGVDQNGPLALTADFGSGTITDTSPGITVNGNFFGAGVTGTVDIGGETSALKAGFFTKPVNVTYPNGYELEGVALGNNMAGVIVAK